MEDELITLGRQQIPREPVLVKKLGRRFLPAVGFLAYGVLYAFLASTIGVVVLFAAVLNTKLPEKGDIPSSQQVVILGSGAAAFLISWVPFALWVSRRRREVYALFREGQIVDSTIASATEIQLREVRMLNLNLHVSDGVRARTWKLTIVHDPQKPLRVGERMPLMVHPRCRYAAAFIDGKALPALNEG